MVILLPHAGISLETLEAKTGAATLHQLMRSHSQEVDLALPKFKMTLPLSLKDHLKRLVCRKLSPRGPIFSKMSPDNDLCISEVIHKAFIEIDEEGTEAAAATAVVMMQTSSAMTERRMPKYFIADRPFLFYIVDNESKAILFMGRLVDPTTA
jgi:serpin B